MLLTIWNRDIFNQSIAIEKSNDILGIVFDTSRLCILVDFDSIHGKIISFGFFEDEGFT